MLNTSLSLIVDFQLTLNILNTSPINREAESKNNKALSTLDQVLEETVRIASELENKRLMNINV